jgi:hypothetical protein
LAACGFVAVKKRRNAIGVKRRLQPPADRAAE